MKRWRKQTRVNGGEVQTLRLKDFTGGRERGVMILLTLTHLKEHPRLSIEIDGDCLVQKGMNEAELLVAAQGLLDDVKKLMFPEDVPQPEDLRKHRPEFPS